MKKILVRLGTRTYPVQVTNNLLKRCDDYIRSATTAKKFLILSVPKVYHYYGKFIERALERLNCESHIFLIQDGESYKNNRELFRLLRKMSELKLQRDSCLISLGGGVIGDLGGFAASIYMRGIDFINCPTTLLSQVDASIGGKTGIDFAGIKNLLGSFYQPKCVLIDPEVLRTLDHRQLRTGLAEIIKYGVIYNENFFSKIEKELDLVLKGDMRILPSLIYQSCLIKARIVSDDEKEAGNRALLNYGHTLGHALESYFNYKALTHGEAIAYGMWFASLVSFKMGLCSLSVVDRQWRLLNKAGLFRKLRPVSSEKIYEKMFLDKKVRKGKILFILTSKIGLVTIRKNVPKSFVFWALDQLRT